jgi:superkiller protein 3
VCYARAEELDPDNWQWPYFLGFCHEAADLPAARVDWLRAEAVMPDYLALQVRLGRAHLALDEPEAAADHYERALRLDGESIPAHIGLARVALAGGDAAAALGHLEDAVPLGPRSGQVDLLRAEAYRLAGEPEASARHAALARGREAVEPLPDAIRGDLGREYGVSLDWRRVRSETYARAGMFDDAAAEWEAAIRDDPESAEAHGQLGLIYARAGRADEAIAAFEKAIELDPYEHSIRSNLGSVLIRRGRGEEGIEYMRQACRFLPDSADAHYNLGVALRAMGRGDEALQALEKACLLEPTHARAQFDRGALLAEQRRFGESVESLRLAVAAAPAERAPRLVLANALHLDGQVAESIAMLRAAVRAFPDDAALVRQLAWRLATSPDDALVDGDAAFGLIEPLCRSNGFGNPIQLDALAAACAARGDFAAAIRHTQRAKALVSHPSAPLDDEARTRMVRMLDGRLDAFRNGRRVRDPVPGAQ